MAHCGAIYTQESIYTIRPGFNNNNIQLYIEIYTIKGEAYIKFCETNCMVDLLYCYAIIVTETNR